jgi:hypothetical protein
VPARGLRPLAFRARLGAAALRDEAPPERTDAVAPPERSDGARTKDRLHRTPDGFAVHTFRSLLAGLGTLTRNRVVLAGGDQRAAFEILADATPLQARALQLASASPPAE